MAFIVYPRLGIEDLIGAVCQHYPSHIVEMVWDFSAHEIRKDIKDTLALYLVKQVRASARSDNAVQNLVNLRADYEQASQDLLQVITGLTEYLNIWLLLDFCHFLKRQERHVISAQLFRSWLSVHDVQAVRDGAEPLLEELRSLFPDAVNNGSITLSDGMLDNIIEQFAARLHRCPEIVPELPKPMEATAEAGPPSQPLESAPAPEPPP